MNAAAHLCCLRLARPTALAVATALVALGLFARILPAWGQAPQHAPRTSTLTITLTVVLGSTPIGDLNAAVTRAGKLVAVEGRPLVNLLRPVVRASKLAELEDKIDAEGMIPADDAAKVKGLALKFDMGLLQIQVEVDDAFLLPHDISLLARGRHGSGFTTLNPADVSGYVNLRSGVDYVDDGATPTHREPATVNLDGAFNTFGTVLEWSATWKEERVPAWARDDVRLVQDFPEELTRVTAGDIQYGLDGFQSSRRLGGITIASNYTLQPNRSIVPAGSTAFDIERASRVEVYLNGQRVQSLQLNPGRYNLRDFPFASGANDVEVRIIDAVGRVETLRFPFVFDTTLLGEGIQEYSYAFGVPADTTASGRAYHGSEGYVFSGFHNYGVTDQFTIGANVQAEQQLEQAGLNARFATVLGTFRTDIAESHSDFSQTDYAARLQYRYSEGPVQRQTSAVGNTLPGSPFTSASVLPTGRSLSINATYRGPQFADLSVDRMPVNPVRLDYGFSYGQRIFGDWFGNVGYTKQIGRGDAPSTDTYTVSASTRVFTDITLSVFGTHRIQSNDEPETAVFVGLSWTPSSSNQRYSVSRDTRTQTTRTTWSYTAPQTVGGVQADASVDRTPSQYNLNGNVRYVDYRYEASLSRDQTYARADDDRGSMRTSARFGTAFVFAGSHFGVSRPINDSFILVAPHPRLSDQTILVNPTPETADARTDWLGSAVVPTVPAYRDYQLSIEAPDLPLGYDLGDQVFTAAPTYKSGTAIEVGTGGTVMLDGTLVDAEGKPIGLYSGHFVSLDDQKQRPIAFFTNRAGRFRVLGLFPGQFELRLDNFPGRSKTVVVPKDATGMYNAGTVVFSTH
jgi:outer membrane usher protein